LSESRLPDLLETLVVRRNGWSCWSRVLCAQGRRATRLRYAPTLALTDFSAVRNFLRAPQAQMFSRPGESDPSRALSGEPLSEMEGDQLNLRLGHVKQIYAKQPASPQRTAGKGTLQRNPRWHHQPSERRLRAAGGFPILCRKHAGQSNSQCAFATHRGEPPSKSMGNERKHRR